MEWFHGPKGLKFSEIGCRPPGVGCWDLYSASNDVDVYREWAHVIVHGVPERQMRRPYSAGIVALRPDADGQITGLQRHRRDAGPARPVDHRRRTSRREGHHTQAVEAGYMANAYVRMRHPDYDTLRGMLDDVGQTIHVLRRLSHESSLMRTILLGPQRFMTTAGTALRSLGVEGPVATINAGWEEREDDVAELDQVLERRARATCGSTTACST